MPDVDLIVIHCSATRPNQSVSIADIDAMHKARGFRCGYHQYITRSGSLQLGRPLNRTGAHTKGFNSHSIGVCLEGGVDLDGKSVMNFTNRQLDAARLVVAYDKLLFPQANVVGHRDMSPDLNGDGVIRRNEWMKDCPCFDVDHWLNTGEAVFQ